MKNNYWNGCKKKYQSYCNKFSKNPNSESLQEKVSITKKIELVILS